MATGEVVRCRIHPGIGIARVGNSPLTTPGHSFFGPEVPGMPPALPDGGFKDSQGRIKRQAALFRVYGYDAHGRVVAELNAENADITWTVHLANKKAAWYQFKAPLDVQGALPPGVQSRRRNETFAGGRNKLVIDPGRRSVVGGSPDRQSFTTEFFGETVTLGQIRTGRLGALVVVGGSGRAGTFSKGSRLTTFANNDGWYDTIADGPVSALVRYRGREFQADPGWVIVAPPDYAPGISGIVTLFDVAHDAWLRAHPAQRPARVSFARDILPILERFKRLEWVNQGFYREFGWGNQDGWFERDHLQTLARTEDAYRTARYKVYRRLREPESSVYRENAWPPVYGDGFDQPPGSDPLQFLTVTREQYRCLGRWAEGDFVADWDPDAPKPSGLGEISVRDRPHALDRAALEACDGGPFHPGTEVTWPLRHSSMYSGLCRLRLRGAHQPEPDYGDVLSLGELRGELGALRMSAPGDITRWMAVPWQTDTASCGSHYPNSTVAIPPEDLPTFWPAAVPNKVLVEAAYRRVMDSGLSGAQRHAALSSRRQWTRHLPLAPYTERLKAMVQDWSRLGIIARRPGPRGEPSLPDELHVETETGFVLAAAENVQTGESSAAGSEDQPAQPLVTNWRELL
ncbi:MAG: LodA/GoxA family CTQ-dependent oxidase [Chloroflexota bacterium]|nr:LodA/GoxA family CTQ-dependent oxidase [Chloroflexota bacterium]